jgi:hypothetical protein
MMIDNAIEQKEPRQRKPKRLGYPTLKEALERKGL